MAFSVSNLQKEEFVVTYRLLSSIDISITNMFLVVRRLLEGQLGLWEDPVKIF